MCSARNGVVLAEGCGRMSNSLLSVYFPSLSLVLVLIELRAYPVLYREGLTGADITSGDEKTKRPRGDGQLARTDAISGDPRPTSTAMESVVLRVPYLRSSDRVGYLE